jgi:hypothetical protein
MSSDREDANKTKAWIERIKHYLFVEKPVETKDPVRAAAEVVNNFLTRDDGWSDFPFKGQDKLPDKNVAVSELQLSASTVDYYGWSRGCIPDYIRQREFNTRCERCAEHIKEHWEGNEVFEREVARLMLESHDNDIKMAVLFLIPTVFDDYELDYLGWRTASHVRDYILGRCNT